MAQTGHFGCDLKSVNESEKDGAKREGLESRLKCASMVTPLKNGTNSALLVQTQPQPLL